MSDAIDSGRAVRQRGIAGTLELARHELGDRHYTVLPSDVIVSAADRQALARTLFVDDVLERDLPTVHPLRDRVDDVIGFRWRGDDLELSEAPCAGEDAARIDIQLTRNFATPRLYKRFAALASATTRELIETVLRLVPIEARRSEGLLGIHAVRTKGIVVPRWHRDGSRVSPVDWVVSYVVERSGAGARSQLALDPSGRNIVAECELRPGQLVMHRDESYYHYVTSLEPTPDVPAPARCALIMMVRPPLPSSVNRGET